MQSSNKSGVKKRKYNKGRNYSIMERLEILKQLDHASLTQVAQQYSVNEKTILYWKKNRTQLTKLSNDIKLLLIQRQKPLFEPLEKPLYIWFYEARLRNIPISNATIKMQALELSKGVYLEDNFVASDYWLNDWKARYQIRQLNSSIDESATIESKEGFARRIQEEGLCLGQIFNADETLLNYRLLPVETSMERKECSVSNSKHNVDRVTIMACCNADASFKLPLVVIGKCERSKIINTVKDVYYIAGASVRMTGRIFKKWFKDEFVPRVTFFLQANNLPLKAMLLLDNTPSHLWTESLSMYNIKAYYLKPDTSQLIQPMKRGIMESLKRSYRLKLLASVVCNQKSGVDAAASMESITVKDAVNWLSEAWNKLSKNTILKSWEGILPEFLKNLVGDTPLEFGITNNDLLSILHNIYNYQNANEDDVRNWIQKDYYDSLDFMPSNVEIIQMAEESNENDNQEVNIAENEEVNVMKNQEVNVTKYEEVHVVKNEEVNIVKNEEVDIAENEQMHIPENEQMHVAENEQMHVAENEESLYIKEESIDIEPEHAVSAANTLILFYERNNLLEGTELEALRRAKDIAMQLRANQCYFS